MDQHGQQIGRRLAALGHAVLAAWTAGTGAALLDIEPRSLAPAIGLLAFILALGTSLYGSHP